MPELFKVADKFFSPEEVGALRTLPPEEQIPAFFRCWTRREALVKALGQGLCFPVSHISAADADFVTVIDKEHPETPAMRWYLQTLDAPPPEHACTVATLASNI
jgi:4'-phosphopantetheinyl transferase